MVMKTGHEIWNGVEDEDRSESEDTNNLPEQKWYLASDIDKRFEFYRKYSGEWGWRDFKKDYPKFLKTLKKFTFKFEWAYNSWLSNFCFTNLDKDFEEMLNGN